MYETFPGIFMLFFQLFHVKHMPFFPGETLLCFHDTYPWILWLFHVKLSVSYLLSAVFRVKHQIGTRIQRLFHVKQTACFPGMNCFT